MYDFVVNSTNASSEISRYAIGKLYIDYYNYPSTKLPYNKILLLKSLAEFDDLEVQIFLSVINYWKASSGAHKKPNKLGLKYLKIDSEGFKDITVNSIAVDYLSTQRIFNNLFSRGLLDEAEAMIGQYSGLNFNYSNLSEQFYKYLSFGYEVFNS